MLALVVLASPVATAQTESTQAAHKFLEQALPRGEASYSGTKITEYGGKGCESIIAFGNSTLAIDWSQITDVKLFVTLEGGTKLNLTGRFEGSKAIQTRDVMIKSDDLSSRVGSAADSLRKACDPLKASGF